jgi:NitT/TauT family transport system substrate-binding protein
MPVAPRGRAPKVGVAVLLAGIVLAIGYLGTRDHSHAQSTPSETLSIAIPLTPHAALLFIAAANGYFAEEGLAVTLLPTIHGKAAIELVVEGKADLGAASDVVFVLSAAKGGGLGIAANMLSATNDLAVIARRDRGISEPRNLVGKRVGVTMGTASEYFLWALLIRNRLAPDSVTLVDMTPGQIASGIAAGSIDATSTWQPNVRDAQLALGDHAVSFYEPLAYAETFNIVGRGEFMKEHGKALEKVIRASLKAEAFCRDHSDAAMKLVAEWLKVEATSIAPAWKNFTFKVDLQHSQLITMEEEARWTMARGYAQPGPIANFLPNLYLDALLAVRPDRVTVIH